MGGEEIRKKSSLLRSKLIDLKDFLLEPVEAYKCLNLSYSLKGSYCRQAKGELCHLYLQIETTF